MTVTLCRRLPALFLCALIGGDTASASARADDTATAGGATVVATVQGSLYEGQRVSRHVWLEAGTRYLISGTCDRDCLDLDLRLFSPNGVELDRDLLSDDVPVVSTTARTTGRYRIDVIMAHCSVEPCGYEVTTVP